MRLGPGASVVTLALFHDMDIHRIDVKFYMDEGSALEPETWFRTFNSWISNTSDEILVDVADYSHVHAGPVTLLVGHEANYCIDKTDEMPGLLYQRKGRLEGGMSDRLRTVFSAALKACCRLEADPIVAGRVKFRGDQILLILNDRLRAPNSEETLAAVRPGLETVLQSLFGGAEYGLEWNEDAKQRFSLRVQAKGDWKTNNLLENI